MTTSTNVVLYARRVKFFSQGDEDALFRWLKKIKVVSDVNGNGDTIEIEIASSSISEGQLREFIALFHRYHIDMSQLAAFENGQNKSWLRNKRAYRYEAMFETVSAAE